jgi:endonuclease YncB( thermonuclease family)
MGTLKINGTIDLNQFWPIGNSDADTTKINLNVSASTFEFKKENQKKFYKTKAYIGAISKGKGSREVIHTSKKDGKQTITIRLQGIDAPELHYKAAPLSKASKVNDAVRLKFNSLNEDRRQCLAESATVALHNFLLPFANKDGLVSAKFITDVNFPSDAIDTYGRFVGNIIVGNNVDINVWLVKHAWAYPAFYTSMTNDEIQVFLDAWKKGKTLAGRLGKYLSNDATDFDWKLILRKKPLAHPFKIGDDKGKVLMPKIFRRQNAWMVQKKAGIISNATQFNAYLKSAPDELRLLEDFLENGKDSSKTYYLHEFVSNSNIISISPEAIVFQEKPSMLFDNKGKKVSKW